MFSTALPPRLTRALAAPLLIGAAVTPVAAGQTAGPTAGQTAGPTAAAASAQGAVVRHDVTFVATMVPHHQTGIAMARVARSRGSSPEIRRLAAQIDQKQSHLATQMTAWLEHHDGSPLPPPQQVLDLERQDLAALHLAEGQAFDLVFLLMMRRHHAQAVAEAQDELRHGRSEVALRMAGAIENDRTAQITTMNGLLRSLLGTPA